MEIGVEMAKAISIQEAWIGKAEGGSGSMWRNEIWDIDVVMAERLGGQESARSQGKRNFGSGIKY